MINVFIEPNYKGLPPHVDNGGIRRVVEAMLEHLPKFNIRVVDNIKEADVICNHGSSIAQNGQTPIVHCGHGFMWSRQPWGSDFMEVNRQVVESMHMAVAHTAPSKWVSNAIRRGGFWYPEVVYHGIDGDKFLPSKHHGKYILWNKARADYVSDPGDVILAAERIRDYEFYSTIGSSQKTYIHSPNFKVIGVQPHSEMKRMIAEAGLYLATARETFGIGTLEALAYGVPVVGWDWGGQAEIIRQGETGYLAPAGDYAALEECVHLAFDNWEKLSKNAILDARENWKWEPRIEQYANIFHRVHERNISLKPKVSVLVSAYNLDKFLPACLDSVLNQTFKDWECIVIDDASSKTTKELVGEYARKDKRFRYTATPENLGLPGARNFGLQNSGGKYIRHLDADDFLSLQALELEVQALDSDKSVDVVYGHLEVVREDGSRFIENNEVVRGGWPLPNFSWYQQMAHLNQLPSCAMGRREVYERSGGYRIRMKRQEDAEFWCRITSFGFRIKKFTQAVTYYHRERGESKGAKEWKELGPEPDWTAWFPWRMGATSFDKAMEVLNKRGDVPPNSHLVPFGAQGRPPAPLHFWYVHDYSNPVVSVIVTCGPGHRKYLLDALDSIQAQTYPDWECIVVNDTGERWDENIMGAPWAKVVNMDGNKGTSAARNTGFQHAKGRFIIWMDADDFWFPWTLQKMVNHAEYNYGVIYSDMITYDGEKYVVRRYREDFQSELVVSDYQYAGSSVLYPRQVVQSIFNLQGGYDEKIPGAEDWDWMIATHHLGFCAYHIQEPLFVYRTYSTTKRENDYRKIDDTVAYVDKKWYSYRNGEKKLMCGCGKTQTPPNSMPSSMMSSSGNFSNDSILSVVDKKNPNQMVMVEYIGQSYSPFRIRSIVDPSIAYRFSASEEHKRRAVFLQDAERLQAQNIHGVPQFRVLANMPVEQAYDPAAFLGEPVA